jgi:hypothetical protein
MNGGNKSTFLRFGLVALVALLALCAASAPASAQTVSINPDGTVTKGVATVTGTFSASIGTPPMGITVGMDVEIVQFRHGQVSASASTRLGPVTADGSIQTWTATMFSAAGFKTGQAQVNVRLFDASNDFENTLATAGAIVQLHAH